MKTGNILMQDTPDGWLLVFVSCCFFIIIISTIILMVSPTSSKCCCIFNSSINITILQQKNSAIIQQVKSVNVS